MGVGALVGGSLVSGLIASRAAGRAADVQADASEAAVAEQQRQFDLTRSDLAPYRNAGGNALAALQYELGLSERPTFGAPPAPAAAGGMPSSSPAAAPGATGPIPVSGVNMAEVERLRGMLRPEDHDEGYDRRIAREHNAPLRAQIDSMLTSIGAPVPAAGAPASGVPATVGQPAAAGGQPAAAGGGFEYRGFQETPGYAYAMEQDQRGLERMAAARGMRLSGATLNEAGRRAQGRANQEYGTYLNRLSGLSGTGQTATNAGAQFGASTAGNIGNALMAGGQARASGYAGQNQAFQGTMDNMFNIYAMNQAGMFGG